ncbi:MAG: phosphoribosylformylglycinamidine synthase, purS protein [Candidatus Omnitrophica bacterium CG1_02_41_171]|nr:MAG: phosphoribosylformylglycinamidine synthase, purS protein [Candidatus Omnitrophica bacterium CG1_02_41_171]
MVEVWLKKGVTDTVAESAAKGIRDLGIKTIKNVKTGKKYLLFGSLSSKEIEIICQRLLVNKVIQNYFIK